MPMRGIAAGGFTEGMQQGREAQSRRVERKQTQEFRKEQMATMAQAREQKAAMFEGDLEQQALTTQRMEEGLQTDVALGKVTRGQAEIDIKRIDATKNSIARTGEYAQANPLDPDSSPEEKEITFKKFEQQTMDEIRQATMEGADPEYIKSLEFSLNQNRVLDEWAEEGTSKELATAYATQDTDKIAELLNVTKTLNVSPENISGNMAQGYTYITDEGRTGHIRPEEIQFTLDRSKMKTERLDRAAAATGKGAAAAQKRIDTTMKGITSAVQKTDTLDKPLYGQNAIFGARYAEDLMRRQGAQLTELDILTVLRDAAGIEDRLEYQAHLDKEFARYLPQQGGAPGAGVAPPGAAAPAPAPEVEREQVTTDIKTSISGGDEALAAAGKKPEEIKDINQVLYGQDTAPVQKVRNQAEKVFELQQEVDDAQGARQESIDNTRTYTDVLNYLKQGKRPEKMKGEMAANYELLQEEFEAETRAPLKKDFKKWLGYKVTETKAANSYFKGIIDRGIPQLKKENETLKRYKRVEKGRGRRKKAEETVARGYR